MKIFVAIPVYDGKIPFQTVVSLLQEQNLAVLGGDEFSVAILPNCSHPGLGRNRLAKDFMDSGAERLVFLDSDVTFVPGQLLRVAKHDVDFVGGAYRYKLDREDYPVGWLPEMRGINLSDNSALIEVKSVPGGFMSLSRKVFEKLKEAHPNRSYEHFGHLAHCYFQMAFTDGMLYGEDAHFCKEYREAGGTVYLDPELNLTHWDFNKPYPGHVGNWLRRRTGIPETVLKEA